MCGWVESPAKLRGGTKQEGARHWLLERPDCHAGTDLPSPQKRAMCVKSSNVKGLGRKRRLERGCVAQRLKSGGAEL